MSMSLPLPKEELAYFAGLFDGEGCVSLVFWNGNNSSQAGQFILTVVVTMNHRPTVERLHNVFSGCLFAPKIYHPQHHQSWRWATRGQSAIDFLELVYPYLVCKREQATEAFLFWEWRQAIGKWKHMSSEQREFGQQFVRKLQELKRPEMAYV